MENLVKIFQILPTYQSWLCLQFGFVTSRVRQIVDLVNENYT